MKRLLSLCLFAPLFIFTSCSKDKQTVIDNTWIVESMKVHADSAWQYPPNGAKYTLSFPDKHTYCLLLDKNQCAEDVKFEANNKFKFKKLFCTAICCDSPFAETYASLFVDTKYNYTINENKLILTNSNNKIILNFIKQ